MADDDMVKVDMTFPVSPRDNDPAREAIAIIIAEMDTGQRPTSATGAGGGPPLSPKSSNIPMSPTSGNIPMSPPTSTNVLGNPFGKAPASSGFLSIKKLGSLGTLGSGLGSSPEMFSLKVLKDYQKNREATVNFFRANGGAKALIGAMETNKGPKVQEAASRAMKEFLAQDNEDRLGEGLFAIDLTRFGGIDACLNAINMYKSTEEHQVITSALTALLALSPLNEARTEMDKKDAIDTLVRLLESSNLSPDSVANTMSLIANLCFASADRRTKLGEKGAIRAVVNGMQAHTDSMEVQLRGAVALRNLGYRCKPNQERFKDDDGIQRLLKLLSVSDDKEVLHQTLAAIANVTNVNTANRQAIAEADGIRPIVHIVQKNENYSPIVNDAMAVLRNIAVRNETAQIALGEANAIDVITKSINDHPNHEKIVEKAVSALRFIFFQESNRLKIQQDPSKIFSTVLNVLKARSSNEVTIENALYLLGNACFNNQPVLEAAGKAGAIDAVLSATEQHKQSAEIQEAGCRCLRGLVTGCEANAIILSQLRSRAVTLALVAMLGHPEVSAVQEQACALMNAMAGFSQENLNEIEEQEVADPVLKAMDRHSKQRGVLYQGSMLIDYIRHYINAGEPVP